MTSAIAKVLGMFLNLLYGFVGHYGISIILFTIIMKLATLPLTLSQNKSMMEMNKVQPLIQEIQKKYPNDKNKQAELTSKIYKEHKINPLAGCLPLLIQLPILMGLFNVLRHPVTYVFGTQALYDAADTGFLWLENLKDPDVIMVGGFAIPFIFPLIGALAQFIDSKMMMIKNDKKKDPKLPEKENPGESMQKTMTYMMPLFIFYWGRQFPAGLSMYWAISTLFSIVQRKVVESITLRKEEEAKLIGRRK